MENRKIRRVVTSLKDLRVMHDVLPIIDQIKALENQVRLANKEIEKLNKQLRLVQKKCDHDPNFVEKGVCRICQKAL